MSIRWTELPSPLGDLLAARTDDGLTGLWYDDHQRGPHRDPSWIRHDDGFADLRVELDAWFAGRATAFGVALAPQGTQFQLQVWDALAHIPHGATTTYAELAGDLGRPSAVRAVAGAIARNPLSIIVPCHRVIGADGSLTGYAGGTDRKRWLLDHEAGTAA